MKWKAYFPSLWQVGLSCPGPPITRLPHFQRRPLGLDSRYFSVSALMLSLNQRFPCEAAAGSTGKWALIAVETSLLREFPFASQQLLRLFSSRIAQSSLVWPRSDQPSHTRSRLVHRVAFPQKLDAPEGFVQIIRAVNGPLALLLIGLEGGRRSSPRWQVLTS